MIVGDRPTTGMRLRLVLGSGKRAFVGTATTPIAQWDVHVEVSEAGEVDVRTTAPQEIAEYARRVVRIAARHSREEGIALPRMIQRWRADKT